MDDITRLKFRGVFLLTWIENTDSLIKSLTIQRDRKKRELTNIEERITDLRG